MQTEPNAKQQIVEKIKSSTNILVTVGSNPSVDSLSAALSLTLMLNRLDKHATAVFSGQVPPAINFLEPSKTFENSVDSLRDFIIALDKEKADRLRYKVEDDVVRIFITPYRTVISEKDLKFSQGDFNVELIIALGVEAREDLDTAVTAHGRILHDATVVTINADGGKSTLGSVDWSDASASSLCEMLMSLSEALQSGLLDQQIATAVLTGIVSATDRFRNEKTSPRVMTMAAQLMAAGANQQLIAAKLEEGHELPATTPSSDGTTRLTEGSSEKVSKEPAPKNDGALEITHAPVADSAPIPDPVTDALKEAEAELAKSLEQTAPLAPTISVDDLKNDLAAAAQEVDEASTTPVNEDKPQVIKSERRSWQSEPSDKPEFGGSLNATVAGTETAPGLDATTYSQPTLDHDSSSVVSGVDAQEGPEQPAITTPEVPEPPVFVPPATAPEAVEQPTESVSKPLESTSDDVLSFEATPLSSSPKTTLADLDEQTRGKAAEDARAAIEAALSEMPFDPSGKPQQDVGAMPVFDIEHGTPSATDSDSIAGLTGEPFQLDDQTLTTPDSSVPPMASPLPPLPDFSTLPPLPGEEQLSVPDISQVPDTPAPFIEPEVPGPSEPTDPGQFKIPGQS